MAQSVTLQLPEVIYERVRRAAEATKRPVEEVLVKTIEAMMPPTVDDLPLSYREEFLSMESLSDYELLKVAESIMPPTQQRRYSFLLRKNQKGTLTEKEREQLAQLGAEARKLTLRKSHAYAILKWRGHRIPTLVELRTQQ
ncbi:hypothetical protein FJZ31_00435 [Candidatus Poribacteria bacterium]|nr:hypothetical protein [Candidatus Poribacteria bacterium]